MVFTDVGENTIIYGGRERNSFIFENAPFEGILRAGSGLRNPAEMMFSVDTISQVAGLNLPSVQVVNTLDLAGSSFADIERFVKVVNLGGLPLVQPRAPGLTSQSLSSIHNITVGPGFNAISGSNPSLPVNLNDEFDIGSGDFGADTFVDCRLADLSAWRRK